MRLRQTLMRSAISEDEHTDFRADQASGIIRWARDHRHKEATAWHESSISR